MTGSGKTEKPARRRTASTPIAKAGARVAGTPKAIPGTATAKALARPATASGTKRGKASSAGKAGGAKAKPGAEAMARPALADAAGRLIDGEAALAEALAELRAIDPVVVDHMLAVGGAPPLRQREPGFAGLAAIIVSQQLSTSSAAAIFGRLEAIVAPLTPEGLLATQDAVLRDLGLSLGKIRSLRATAEAIVTGALPMATLGSLPAEAAHAAMVAIHGIGPWTADIFLLFCLGHPDAWPAGDLALQEAARVVLACDTRPSTAELNRLGERWRPYRGVAARLLWAYYRVMKQGRSGMTLASP